MFQGGAQEYAPAAEGTPPDLQGMLMHHLLDGKEIEFEVLGRGFVWHLPTWEPIHIGSSMRSPKKKPARAKSIGTAPSTLDRMA